MNRAFEHMISYSTKNTYQRVHYIKFKRSNELMMERNEANDIFTLLKTAYHLQFTILEEINWKDMLVKFGDYKVTRKRLENYIVCGNTHAPTIAYLIGLNNLENTH